jgi:hypothetical protein
VTTPRDRGGPQAPWLVVLLVVLSGASIMGWTIYQLLRAAMSQ